MLVLKCREAEHAPPRQGQEEQRSNTGAGTGILIGQPIACGSTLASSSIFYLWSLVRCVGVGRDPRPAHSTCVDAGSAAGLFLAVSRRAPSCRVCTLPASSAHESAFVFPFSPFTLPPLDLPTPPRSPTSPPPLTVEEWIMRGWFLWGVRANSTPGSPPTFGAASRAPAISAILQDPMHGSESPTVLASSDRATTSPMTYHTLPFADIGGERSAYYSVVLLLTRLASPLIRFIHLLAGRPAHSFVFPYCHWSGVLTATFLWRVYSAPL